MAERPREERKNVPEEETSSSENMTCMSRAINSMS